MNGGLRPEQARANPPYGPLAVSYWRETSPPRLPTLQVWGPAPALAANFNETQEGSRTLPPFTGEVPAKPGMGVKRPPPSVAFGDTSPASGGGEAALNEK